MKGAPRSSQFDDVYFSVDDGLAETRHVFMQGNDLPHFWQEKGAAGAQDFVIAETGFGTGLNFLCAWKEFCETAPLKMRRFNEWMRGSTVDSMSAFCDCEIARIK